MSGIRPERAVHVHSELFFSDIWESAKGIREDPWLIVFGIVSILPHKQALIIKFGGIHFVDFF